MPREVAVFDLYMPGMGLLFVLAMILAWLLDRLLASLDLYRLFWHPALLRLSLFTCVFSALALGLYR